MVSPALVVFDLDACCWYPEMYMIRRGAPFSSTADPNVLKTAGGQAVRLLGNVRHIWKDGDGAFCVFCLYLPWRLLVDSAKELHSSPKFADTRVGVASRCDHPDWGRECLRKFMVQDGVSMWDVAEGGELVEIMFSSKREHFRRLAVKTGVAFEDMLFFDDDPSNIQDSILTAEAWEEGLKQYSKRKADDAARRLAALERLRERALKPPVAMLRLHFLLVALQHAVAAVKDIIFEDYLRQFDKVYHGAERLGEIAPSG
eukprot:s565_g15.t1